MATTSNQVVSVAASQPKLPASDFWAHRIQPQPGLGLRYMASKGWEAGTSLGLVDDAITSITPIWNDAGPGNPLDDRIDKEQGPAEEMTDEAIAVFDENGEKREKKILANAAWVERDVRHRIQRGLLRRAPRELLTGCIIKPIEDPVLPANAWGTIPSFRDAVLSVIGTFRKDPLPEDLSGAFTGYSYRRSSLSSRYYTTYITLPWHSTTTCHCCTRCSTTFSSSATSSSSCITWCNTWYLPTTKPGGC